MLLMFPDKYKKDTSNNSPSVSGKHYPEGTNMEATALCAQLEERVKVHRNQVLTLLKDREISWKERNLEQRRLQEQVSALSNR
jgi:transposase